MVVPYEWCRSEATGDRVLVLWLNEDLFADQPLSRLALFLRTLPDLRRDGHATVIGPWTSTVLTAMAAEARGANASSPPSGVTRPDDRAGLSARQLRDALDGVRMLSGTATADVGSDFPTAVKSATGASIRGT